MKSVHSSPPPLPQPRSPGVWGDAVQADLGSSRLRLRGVKAGQREAHSFCCSLKLKKSLMVIYQIFNISSLKGQD